MQKDLSDEELRLAKLVLIAILALVLALGISFIAGAMMAKMTIQTVTCNIR